MTVPKQNRVNPLGELISVPDLGRFMGNRGCLHDGHGQIIKPWIRKAWIACLLEFKDRHREVMSPGKYTELFFLDEATALAAGHRPCATCQRDKYNEFISLWNQAKQDNTSHGRLGAKELDEQLHQERLLPGGQKKLFTAFVEDLADGIMVLEEGQPYLLWEGRLLAWSFSGYSKGRQIAPREEFEVLTPRSVVGAIRSGYSPDIESLDE